MPCVRVPGQSAKVRNKSRLPGRRRFSPPFLQRGASSYIFLFLLSGFLRINHQSLSDWSKGRTFDSLVAQLWQDPWGLLLGQWGPDAGRGLWGRCQPVGCTGIARPRVVWGGAPVFVLTPSFLHIPCFSCRETDLYHLVFLTSFPLGNASPDCSISLGNSSNEVSTPVPSGRPGRSP